MHLLVQLQQLARQEFLRGIAGITDEDARKRIRPMNCISWIIAHMAAQEHALFVAWPHGKPLGPQYQPFRTGSPPSQPSLDEAMTLWRAARDAADQWLHSVSDEELRRVFGGSPSDEDAGTLVVRNTFHYWSHTGETSAIRQMLGHENLPQFVNMHGWSYRKGRG